MYKLHRGLIAASLLLALDANAFEAGGGNQMVGSGRQEVTTTTTTTTTAGGFTVTDYTPSMDVYYDFESDTPNLGLNDLDTVGGSNCHLTEVNSPTQNTTGEDYREGSASIQIDDTNDRYLTISAGSCSAIDYTGAFTCGLAVKQSTSGQNDHWVGNNGQTGTNGGYMLRTGSGNRLNCWVNDGDAAQALEPGSEDISGNWIYNICSHDGSTTITDYKWYNDQNETSWTGTNGPPSVNSTDDWRIGTNQGASGGTHDGPIDEVWCIGANLTAAQRCRIVSCGVKGDQSVGGFCTCSSATAYADTGRNDQTCSGGFCTGDGLACTTTADCISGNGCTLPNCTAAAP
jgi:hypothetical protein